jgi:CubicO group peptidase (beta-lactamase class C family)
MARHALTAFGLAIVVALTGAAPASAARMKRCALPAAGQSGELVDPADVALDPKVVQDAIDFASTRLRASVKVWRNNCLVGQSRIDPVTERVPLEEWSSTKSVTALLAGIAEGDGKLELDDPIGKYLPTGPGWGDEAHRAITIRQLLTQTAGLRQSILSEAGTVGNDPHIAKQALALPLEHEPGTYFEYIQRVPDLLAFVVQQAVGVDLQTYAQKRLFGPIGIRREAYFWLRDRSGNTYGHAHLFLPPRDFTRIGLLLTNGGRWGRRQVVPKSYVKRMARPSPKNPCYGFLVWTNYKPCVSPSIFARRTLDVQPVASAPDDLFATVGAFQQNNFVIPSLGMTVTWNGQFGDLSSDPQTLLSANPHSELYYTFFRKLMRGVKDKRIHDPGPYVDDPVNDIKPFEFADPAVLLGGLGLGPYAPENCNVLACDGSDLTAGPSQMLPDIVQAIITAATP